MIKEMKFSERIGATPVRESLQIESIDARLEDRLWNVIYGFLKNIGSSAYKDIWDKLLEKRVDEIPRNRPDAFGTKIINTSKIHTVIKEQFFKDRWYEKYDLIEFLAKLSAKLSKELCINFTKSCNDVLEEEMAGYRIVDKRIAPVTSEEQIVEIEKACTTKWESVNTHTKTALKYLSNREKPDYRNSIKESISAVESLCRIITNKKTAKLADALKEIENKFPIHGALKSAFLSLYGYTSDSGGIRHCYNEDDITPSEEDARFMLVSCSAFINYLIVKIEKQPK